MSSYLQRAAFIYTAKPSLRLVAGAAAAALVLVATGASAQSLRGSASSVGEMHGTARARGLAFHRNADGVRRAVRTGELVKLTSSRVLATTRISHPYVRPVTRVFIQRLAAQYHDACGERLVVTSAVRPLNRQPRNGSPLSVHPTGIAVDLRKPSRRSCLVWLRARLLELEGAGMIEATEEFRPPHFHVAVYGTRPRFARIGTIQRSDDGEGDAAGDGGRADEGGKR